MPRMAALTSGLSNRRLYSLLGFWLTESNKREKVGSLNHQDLKATTTGEVGMSFITFV
jgi:hypothetical protein